MTHQNLSLVKCWKLFWATLKGHCHGILASFYNAEICSCINGNPKIMMQFCYLGLYHYTETIYCRLALSMARMEMDWNLKKLASFFKFESHSLKYCQKFIMVCSLHVPPFVFDMFLLVHLSISMGARKGTM